MASWMASAKNRGLRGGPLLASFGTDQNGLAEVQVRRLERHLCPREEVVRMCTHGIRDGRATGRVERVNNIDLEN